MGQATLKMVFRMEKWSWGHLGFRAASGLCFLHFISQHIHSGDLLLGVRSVPSPLRGCRSVVDQNRHPPSPGGPVPG